ncbi:LamG domain-containing protein [Streptomyces cyaneofuscatus]|uniref:LamG domain-containing protein n=1 Tax=Streptomyces cyaneofuscatus TaxID=66883 RepID=UPI003414CBAC
MHERQQIVLWHLFVEQEDIAQVGLYAGVGRAVVQRWSETAEDEFRTVYGRLYEESAPPDCRPFSRLVVTTARTGLARTVGTDGFNEIGGHLGGCEDCSRAFHDLSRLNGKEWAPLLAESLLPWNGKQYRADRTRARAGERQPPVRSAASSPVPSGLRLPVPRRWPGKAVLAVVAAAVVLGVFLGPGGSGPASSTSSTTTARNSSGFDAWGRDTRPVGEKKQATPTPRPAPPPVTTGPAAAGALSSSPARKAPGKPKNPKAPPGKPSQPGPSRVGLADTRLRWDFRSAGTRPADTSSFGRSGTYHGHVDWREDRGGSVWFDGDSFVRTEQAALDTSHSFTVSAWARLTSDDGFHTVAGQDGDNISGFFLQSTQDDNRWRLAMGHRDSAAAGEDQVLSAAPPAKDAWQHLTGVYDAEKRQIRLYVDGRLQGTAERTSSWRANGPFTVGRGLREGDKADKYKGYIDDVRVFQRAVSAAEATALADAGPNS